jgi:Fe-S cluster assembly protein SufD
MHPGPGSNFSADALRRLPGPPRLSDQRFASWQRFEAAPRPSESDEIWRYSRIDDLELGDYAPLLADDEVPAQLPAAVQALVGATGPGATVLVTRNGGRGTVLGPQAGLSMTSASDEGAASETGRDHEPGGDLWADLNGAFCLAPWTVRVEAGTALAGPVVVVHWLDAEGAALFPRLTVEMGAGASARVVEILASPDVGCLAVPVAELYLAERATLGFGQVQLLGGRAWQLGNQWSRVAAGAALQSMTVAFGGDYARVLTTSVLDGEGGESELLAAYFGSGKQVHDLRTVQHHGAPSARSNLLFKGAVADEARSVYSGLIRVEKGAKGTNAFQTNRNLVLSGGAQAYSVPNLEIEDNDVRCSHASAVGPIDEAQLFYLESRGVPTRAAERLIALGFMDDVFAKFPVPALQALLREALAAKLSAAGFGPSSGQAA